MHRIATLSFIKDRVKDALSGRGKGDDTCFNEVSTLGKIDSTWMAAFLCSISNLKTETLAQCKIHDADSIKQLFCMVLHASPLCKVPQCINEAVMDIACSNRVREVGNRMAGLGD